MPLLKQNQKPAANLADVHKANENSVKPSYVQVTALTPLKRPNLTNSNSKPNNQVHLIVSINREFRHHANHHKQMK